MHSYQTCQHNALKYFGISLWAPYVTVPPHSLKSCPKAHSRRVSTAVSYFTPHPRLLSFGALARLVKKIQNKILQEKNTLKKKKRKEIVLTCSPAWDSPMMNRSPGPSAAVRRDNINGKHWTKTKGGIINKEQEKSKDDIMFSSSVTSVLHDQGYRSSVSISHFRSIWGVFIILKNTGSRKQIIFNWKFLGSMRSCKGRLGGITLKTKI